MYSRAALSPMKKARKRKERLIILSFLAPNLIGFLMFTVFPVFAAMFLSFSEWNIISDIKWVGFDNYSKLFTSKRFWQAVYHTLEYTVVSVPIGLLLAMFFAVLMNRKIRGVTFFRTVYYLPVVSSTVAVAMLWKFIYADNVGLLASIFRFLGLEAPKWISSTKWALRSIMIMSTWQGLGYNIVIILAGLQGISSVYYEAARIDGASGWQQFWRITFPLLTPTMFFLLIMSIIGSFQVFEATAILTEGGPGFASTTIVYYIYTTAFENLKFGFACSMAIILFVMILVVTIVQWIGQKRWVVYDA